MMHRLRSKLALAAAAALAALTGCDKPGDARQVVPGQVAASPSSQSTRAPSLVERCDARMAQASDGRIVGGEEAAPRSAPWQTQLYSTVTYSDAERRFDARLPVGDECKRYLDKRAEFETAHKCGGSYIGDGWIVTAAHCVARMPRVGSRDGNVLVDRRIRLGTQNLLEGGQTFAIDAVVIHPDYVARTKRNDIALVHFAPDARSEALERSGLLAAVKTGTEPPAIGEELRVTGWGWMGRRDHDNVVGAAILRDRDGGLQHVPAGLRQLAIHALDPARCAPLYPGFDAATMLCAATLAADGRTIAVGKDACQNDSGGPVTQVSPDGTARELAGIVSAGIGCGAGKPAIYTRVSHYQTWIRRSRAGLGADRVVIK